MEQQGEQVTTGTIPIEQQVLDPRAIARASLAAGENASLWWTSAAVVVATVIALTVGTRAGGYAFATVAAGCAVLRAVLPSPGPVALSVRRRSVDVTLLLMLAIGIGALTVILPDGRAV
ncbi:DUF3017 domain-containing protein [Cellulomonas soli]|uniref:DUF3017 domain-containing protein n=1 Tax=Cellulomonas soli TaxID=931535 RepID=UPI003F84FDED